MPARHTARRCAALALLIAAGSFLTPARAAESATPMPSSALPPDAVVTAAADGSLRMSHPGLNRDAVVEMADRRYGAFGALDVTRALLAQHHGIDLPDLHPASRLRSGGQEAEAIAVPVVLQNGTGSTPSPTGDLDGDGRDDVILYSFDDEAERLTMRAVSGLDGAELWRRAPASWTDVLAYPVADVTGDGRTDLFRAAVTDATYEYHEMTCEESAGTETCGWSYEHEYRWSYGVVSGADGVDLWEQSVDAKSGYRTTTTRSESLTESSDSYEVVYGGVNQYLALDPAGDYNRDGVSDVVVNILGITERSYDVDNAELVVFRSNEWDSTDRASTTGSVVEGATGDVLFSRTTVDAPSLSWLMEVSQMVGDATPDLLWETNAFGQLKSRCSWVSTPVTRLSYECDVDESRPAHGVTAVDGATLAEAWSYVNDDHSWFANAFPVADMSGDGVIDVAVTSWADRHTQFLSGSTGAGLWDMPALPFAIDDDAVVVVSLETEETDEYVPVPVGLDVQRRDPATGDVVQHSTFVVDATVPDRTKWDFTIDYVDGRVLVAHWQASVSEDGTEVREERSHILVEDGHGGLLVNRQYDEARTVRPFADVDGDGATDVVDIRIAFEYDERWDWLFWQWEQEALRRVADDSLVWTVPADAYLAPGGNQDGVAGEEVMATTYADDVVEVASLDGPTGARRWALTL